MVADLRAPQKMGDSVCGIEQEPGVSTGSRSEIPPITDPSIRAMGGREEMEPHNPSVPQGDTGSVPCDRSDAGSSRKAQTHFGAVPSSVFRQCDPNLQASMGGQRGRRQRFEDLRCRGTTHNRRGCGGWRLFRGGLTSVERGRHGGAPGREPGCRDHHCQRLPGSPVVDR